jgi:putative hydrolase of the HAD superfamily
MIRGLMFDLGETLTEPMIDDVRPLNELPLSPFSDAISTLTSLKSEAYKFALVTNTCQSNEAVVSHALDRIGLRPFFDVIITSVDLGCEKPAPGMFLAALAQINCKPHEAVMIGDNIVNDIQGASHLGIFTILVQRAHNRSVSPAVKPTYTVTSLSEIPAALRRISYVVDGH